MFTASRRRAKPTGIKVQVYDPANRKSRSLTVYTTDVEAVARAVESAVSSRWTSTRLDSARHRRR